MRLTKEIFLNENIQSSATVLDAGCGIGDTSILLAEMFHCHIEAIDQHPEMVRVTAAKAKNSAHAITVAQGNIENLPYKNETFEVIISESVTAFTNTSKTLAEFSRTLKENGVLYLIEMTVEQPFSKDEEEEFLDFYGMEEMLTEEGWKERLKKAGFQTVQVVKANTVSNEMSMQSAPEGQEQPVPFVMIDNDDLRGVLEDHYVLTYQYAEKLGYRVFRAQL